MRLQEIGRISLNYTDPSVWNIVDECMLESDGIAVMNEVVMRCYIDYLMCIQKQKFIGW